ncbi:hypothetical protein [Mucilaginibacter segetis]|uniref:Uncharacterized protein n=1 Tax=Mucilaginibacter segetis TaxID=2793071 RepID=A0A934UM16_9SPHI|nr:hypothetical protein [Mucilaginibacter segetis]MBK0378426.1 hypothetical protein [Mucilaginibacter segetis]
MLTYRKPKKLIALFLLGAFLLNMVGDIAVHQYLVYKSDRFFNHQTSKGLYKANDLTEVRLPVSMPGVSDWAGYEMLSGEVRFADAAYNYVGMKMTHNAIYLLCVPNYKTTKLSGRNIIHAENMEHPPVQSKQRVPFNKLSMLSYFKLDVSSYEFTLHYSYTPLKMRHTDDDQIFRNNDIPEQPPQAGC